MILPNEAVADFVDVLSFTTDQ